MMGIVNMVSEYLVNLGLDIAKNTVEEKIDEVKLKRELKAFIERQEGYNEICSLKEECDFKGLIDYISNNLIEDVKTRCRSTNSKERGRARQQIVNKAVIYSSANTDESKRRIAKLVYCSLDILREFFKRNIRFEDYLLATDVVDAVKENTAESVENAKEEIIKAINERNDASEKSSFMGSLFSLDAASSLVSQGKYADFEGSVNKLFNHISVEHPLYPEFGFKYEDGKLKSIPLTNDAAKLYPTNYQFKGKVRAGTHCFIDPNERPLEYAYHHQIPLTISVAEATKFLGDIPDPIQSDVAGLPGKDVVLMPPPFPFAFPCSIKVKDVVFYDYILLRTQEILDDGTYIISNKEQSASHVYFELHCRIITSPIGADSLDGVDYERKEEAKSVLELEISDFKTQFRGNDNSERLKYKRFVLALSSQGNLHVYHLEQQKDFFEVNINCSDLNINITSVREEVDFLERICAIEKHFNVHFDLSEKITDESYQLIIRISELITNKRVEFKWVETEITGTISEYFKGFLEELKASTSMFSCVYFTEVNMLGAKFSFKYMKTYREAIIQDAERLKQLLTILNDGDPLKIKLKPGKDNTGFYTMNIPESLLDADDRLCAGLPLYD